jgi:hypothetical protein
MGANAPEFYAKQFATNIELLSQQKGSKLRGSCREQSHIGESAQPVDQIGTVEAQLVVNRFAPLVRTDAPKTSRWVDPNPYDLTQHIDNFDKLKMLVDPQSDLAINAAYAFGRKMDDNMIGALGGSAKTGIGGNTSTILPAAQVVGVSTGAAAPAGLNVDKLIAAQEKFMSNDVDMDDMFTLVIKAKQYADMLRQAQVVSTDFNNRPVLVDGKLGSFLGFNIIQTQRLLQGTDDAAGSSTACYAYAKSGLHLGIWKDIISDISQRKDLSSLPWQIYNKMMIGATRLEEVKVVKIWAR